MFYCCFTSDSISMKVRLFIKPSSKLWSTTVNISLQKLNNSLQFRITSFPGAGAEEQCVFVTPPAPSLACSASCLEVYADTFDESHYKQFCSFFDLN